jgi:hypothetical protein
VQKAPLVGFEKKRNKKLSGDILKGSREELMGVTIPLKYLPCNKKNNRAGIMNGIGVKWLYL